MITGRSLLLAAVAAPVLASVSGAQTPAPPPVDPVDALRRCATIADAALRLECFDSAVVGVPESTGAPSAAAPPASADMGPAAPPAPSAPPAAVTASRAASRSEAEAARETYGLPQPREQDAATFVVARFETTPDDRLQVVMENGQVWRQIDYEPVFPPEDGTVSADVRPGLFNSYFMTLNGGRRFRVRRTD